MAVFQNFINGHRHILLNECILYPSVSICIHLYSVVHYINLMLGSKSRLYSLYPPSTPHRHLASFTCTTTKPVKMPMIKFSYFDMEAKGELTRLLLHAGNFDFEDHRIPFEDWPGEHKSATTFGQLPVLRWDGEELAQSMAIVRLIPVCLIPDLALVHRTSNLFLIVFYCMMAITFDVAMQLVICGAFNSKRMLYRFNNPDNYSMLRRFVARRAGLAGKTDLEFAQADMVASHSSV